MRQKLLSQNVMSGLMLAVIGLLALIIALKNYTLGTAARMGPGYVPMLCSIGMIAIGAVLIAGGLLRRGAPVGRLYLRPLLVITAALALFALLLQRIGLPLTVAIAVAVSAFARPGARIVETLALAILTASGTTILFIYALGLPITLWGAG